MVGPRWAFSRRAALCGSALALAGIAPAAAQTELERSKKIQAWMNHIRTTPNVAPMSNGSILDFKVEQVQRKQIGLTVNGVQRLFAVVTPYQRDGIVLAAGNPDTRTFGVHRTGTHLRRVSSGRNAGGQVSRWSGPECDDDFQAQIAFWVARPIG
jgi:hypothetical protein